MTDNFTVMRPVDDELSRVLFALADPTRRSIVEGLRDREASAMDVAASFTMSQPAVSKHLAVLERAGLITRHRVSRKNMCRLQPAALKPLSEWVGSYQAFWEGSFERLDALLAEGNEDAE